MDLDIQETLPKQVLPAVFLAAVTGIHGSLLNSPERNLMLGILAGQLAIAVFAYFIAPYWLAAMKDIAAQQIPTMNSGKRRRYVNISIFFFRIFLLALMEAIWILDLVFGNVLFRSKAEIDRFGAGMPKETMLIIVIGFAAFLTTLHFLAARHIFKR